MIPPVANALRTFESIEGRLIFGRTTRIRHLFPGPHPQAYRTTAHHLQRPDGAVLEGWSATPIDGAPEGVILYFGGRNENVAWAPDMASFNPRHAVWAFNYRGFGGSTGRPSERRAKADAHALLDFVATCHPGLAPALVGRSLGTAVALSLAGAARPLRLVLMSPFESVPGVLRARAFGFAGAPLVTQCFDGMAAAAAHAGHTLVLLAGHDTSIPHAQSQRLCARLPRPPQVETIAGTTHRSLPRSTGAQRAIAAFLAGAVPGETVVPSDHFAPIFMPSSA